MVRLVADGFSFLLLDFKGVRNASIISGIGESSWLIMHSKTSERQLITPIFVSLLKDCLKKNNTLLKNSIIRLLLLLNLEHRFQKEE